LRLLEREAPRRLTKDEEAEHRLTRLRGTGLSVGCL
jgi:hypothetical protein